MDAAFWALHRRVAPFTMTSPERLVTVRDAAHYVVAANVPGAVVECGVWRGGSAMMAGLSLEEAGDRRELWLYDTFEGMSEPTAADRTYDGRPAADVLAAAESGSDVWAGATLDDVRRNVLGTGVQDGDLHLIPGKVEQTIPAQAPDEIAILRLDTDWYESTRHELQHLYPRLSPRGVLIIDDYGHWQGARQAVDEYFAEHPIFLGRSDYTGRVAIKSP